MPHYSRFEAVELMASSARTADTNGDSVRLLEGVNIKQAHAVGFVLDLTAAATGGSDTLDVFIQTRLDGTNWVDIVHFTQCLGNGGAKRYFAKIAADVAQAMFENATALSASAVRNLLGIEFRARAAIVDAGGGVQSFTFSVTAVPQ